MSEADIMLNVFKNDVLEGFRSSPKRLSSKYFYDEVGDKLFQQIMAMPSYYLTRCEKEIFETQKAQILEQLRYQNQSFDLVEFGAGDGKKTKVLLRYFLEAGVEFTYRPVDISANILNELTQTLRNELPELKVEGLAMDYFKALTFLKEHSDRPKVLFFLGSNIGNFVEDLRYDLLGGISNHLNAGDKFFIGMDLKKEPRTILKAYDDDQGITAAFNKNILTRIQHEMAPSLQPEKFLHYPTYNPVTGEARSYLLATEDMQIDIDGETILFHAYEPIHTEVSKKFSQEEIDQMIEKFNFSKGEQFYDSKRYYLNSLWIKK